MGSAISCEKCSTAETSSVINLSNDLILRMVEGKSWDFWNLQKLIQINIWGVEPCKKSQTKVVSMEDSDWFEKLHCIDDAHSAAYGLTFNELDKYIKKVESILIHGTVREQCLTNLVIRISDHIKLNLIVIQHFKN